jgi:soluble lytic murein transglycosylase-like protein
MIRYDAGILTMQFRPLHTLRLLLIAAVIFGGLLIPGTEMADDEVQPTTPTWVISARAVATVLERRTTYPPEERDAIARAVAKESEASNLDPLFTLAVIEAESGFDHAAVSTWTGKNGVCVANARGLMQITDATWKGEVTRRGLPHMDRFNPTANVVVGVGYLAHLHDLGYKNFNAMLTAYLLGPGGALPVLRGTGAPEPTEYAHAYVKRVRTFYERNLAAHGHDPKQARALFASR